MPLGRQQGYALLALLGLVGLLGLGLAWAGPHWQDAQARERELEWLRVGQMYAQALTQYRADAPGSLRELPRELGELVRDGRYIAPRRQLRALYTDPLRPGQPWAVLRDASRQIVGVYSLSTATPFMQSSVAPPGLQPLGPGEGYQRWVFLAAPPSTAPRPS